MSMDGALLELTDERAGDCPTRITLLLDTLAGGPRGCERPRFHTFDILRRRWRRADHLLKMPEVLVGERMLDTSDRVQLGAALVPDLVNAGL
jgi:hypothetical protein